MNGPEIKSILSKAGLILKAIRPAGEWYDGQRAIWFDTPEGSTGVIAENELTDEWIKTRAGRRSKICPVNKERVIMSKNKPSNFERAGGKYSDDDYHFLDGDDPYAMKWTDCLILFLFTAAVIFIALVLSSNIVFAALLGGFKFGGEAPTVEFVQWRAVESKLIYLKALAESQKNDLETMAEIDAIIEEIRDAKLAAQAALTRDKIQAIYDAVKEQRFQTAKKVSDDVLMEWRAFKNNGSLVFIGSRLEKERSGK